MSPHLYDAHGNLMDPDADGQPHDYFGRPLSPEDVARRSQPVSRGYYEDEHERLARLARRTERRRKGDNRRTKVLFVLLGVVGAATGYMSYDAGRDSATGLERNAYDASYASCVSGSELRIVMADGLDSLRRLAVSGGDAPTSTIIRFFEATQPPIDNLLTQAAFERESGRRYEVRAGGEVTAEVEAEVIALARERCEARTLAQFPGVAPADAR